MAEPPRRITVVARPVHPNDHYVLRLRCANKLIRNAGRWSLPGGHPVPGETLGEAIVFSVLTARRPSACGDR
ncbi:hypothetical protein ACIRBZ_36010 [Streptomyces sp. NPDC094038]|uniref:hypothetical protein n=1 Tax=Streptomyces sp. NPDC094038 TaxID=3366055 RepID=UPI0037F7CEA7